MKHWIGVTLAMLLAVLVYSPNASAMKVYNKSDHSVFVYVVVGHDAYEGKSGTYEHELRAGRSVVFKPGNLHRSAQRDYSIFVWRSHDAWRREEGLAAFVSALSSNYRLVDDWLRSHGRYEDPSRWPEGLLMIGEGFDDDGFWLKYYGEGGSVFAEKGGCYCEGDDWRPSGNGCEGKGYDAPDRLNNSSEGGTPHPDKACVKQTPDQHFKAKYKGKSACPKGSFHDPRNGGECWSCPSGNNRTAYAVTSNKACSKPAYTLFKRAVKKRKNSRVGQGCPDGQFWDVKGGNGLLGACYSCGGYNRTTRAVDHAKACSKRFPETLKKATYKRKWGCKNWEGSFLDPRKGGECWICPNETQRTVKAVTSNEACKKPAHDIYKRATTFVNRQ